MTAAGATVARNDRIDIDRLERRYRLVYPLNIFLENARQVVVVSAVGLIVAAAVYFLNYALSPAGKAPIEIQVFLVTAFSSFLVVGWISLWALTVRNFWKVGSLLTLVLALALCWSLYGIGTEVSSSIIDLTTRLVTAAPIFAALLLAVISLTVAYYAHLIWTLFEAAFGLALVSAADRQVLRDRPSRKVPGAGFLSRFWAFPPLFRFARRWPLRYAAIIVLSLVCAFLFSVATFLPIILKGPIEDIPRLTEKCDADIDCILKQVILLLDLFFIPLAALVVCLVIGWLGQRALRSLLRFSLESLQEVDARPPILFLRAFRDDQVPLRTRKVALFGRVLELGRRSGSLDQLLLDEATAYGPVVALGSPTDKRPPYGAARGYFTGETWQDAVANLAASSDFIVICVDDTAGVWWEVEQIVHVHLGKTLFLIHPRYTAAADNALILARISQYFRGRPEAEMLQTQGQSPMAPVIGFFRDQSGRLSLLQTSTFSRFAYLLALRVFIRRRLAAQGEPSEAGPLALGGRMPSSDHVDAPNLIQLVATKAAVSEASRSDGGNVQ